MKTYPIFLVGLRRRRCVVVGGGSEALRKVEGLLDCDASVTVVAAKPVTGLRDLVRAGRVDWTAREYRRGDLTGAFLVLAAQQDAATNAEISAEAEAAGILLNVMDDVEHSNFIAGSVVRRGSLAVAVSTGGSAPALAVRLRQRLENELGPEHDLFLRWMRELREPVFRRFPDFEQRRRLWYRLVDSDALDLLRSGQPEAARRSIDELIDNEPLGPARETHDPTPEEAPWAP